MKDLYFLSLIVLFGMGGCSSQKKLVENPAFEVVSAQCFKIMPGREESNPQLILTVQVSDLPADVTEAEVLFRGQVEPYVIVLEEGRSSLRAIFSEYGPAKPDIVMDGDSTKEGGNQPPEIQPLLKEFPFELGKDEAVFRYKQGNKYTYFKVSSITDGRPQIRI
jgi:hypothetical protein